MTAKGWDKGCLDKLWGVLMLWSWWSATCQLILNILYWFERPKFGLKESKQSQPNGSKIFRLNFPRVLYDAYKLRTSQSAHRQCRGQRCLEVEVPFEAEKVSWAVSVASMSLHFWDAHFVTVSFLFVLDISCSRVDVFLVKAASWGRQPLRNNSPKKWPIVHPVIEMHIYPLRVHTTTSQNSPVDVSFLAPLMLFMLRTIGLTVLVLLRGQSCCHGCHILNTDNRPYMPFNCVWRWFTPEKHRGNNIHAVQKLRKNYCTSFEKRRDLENTRKIKQHSLKVEAIATSKRLKKWLRGEELRMLMMVTPFQMILYLLSSTVLRSFFFCWWIASFLQGCHKEGVENAKSNFATQGLSYRWRFWSWDGFDWYCCWQTSSAVYAMDIVGRGHIDIGFSRHARRIELASRIHTHKDNGHEQLARGEACRLQIHEAQAKFIDESFAVLSLWSFLFKNSWASQHHRYHRSRLMFSCTRIARYCMSSLATGGPSTGWRSTRRHFGTWSRLSIGLWQLCRLLYQRFQREQFISGRPFPNLWPIPISRWFETNDRAEQTLQQAAGTLHRRFPMPWNRLLHSEPRCCANQSAYPFPFLWSLNGVIPKHQLWGGGPFTKDCLQIFLQKTSFVEPTNPVAALPWGMLLSMTIFATAPSTVPMRLRIAVRAVALT